MDMQKLMHVLGFAAILFMWWGHFKFMSDWMEDRKKTNSSSSYVYIPLALFSRKLSTRCKKSRFYIIIALLAFFGLMAISAVLEQ